MFGRDEDDYLDTWGEDIYTALVCLMESDAVSRAAKASFLEDLRRQCRVYLMALETEVDVAGSI